MKRLSFLPITLLLLLTSTPLFAQQSDTVRVCTYNVLRFGGNAHDRLDELRMILNAVRPEILLVQEIAGPEGYALFNDSVALALDLPLDGVSFRGEDQDGYSAIFIDRSQFGIIIERELVDSPRIMVRARLYHYPSNDTIEVWTGHWKAGEASADEELRRLSAERLVTAMSDPIIPDQLGVASNIVLGADLNVYASDESAYALLTGAGPGHLVDPIGRPGDWHNDSAFADIHTQSPRVRQFGGGIVGGIDDRFDQVLVSPPLLDNYLPGSYTTFGNDGLHFNDSINALPNLAVGTVMAQALHDASDHLPVYLDLVFPNVVTDVHETAPLLRLDLVDQRSR